MKYNELIDGKIYVTWYENQGDYIFKQSNNTNKHSINKNSFNKRSGLHNQNGFIEFREATNEEVQWLNECIRQNKFVPKNEVKFNIELEYEIC